MNAMKTAPGILALIFLSATLQVACEENGRYRLSWSFEDAEITDAAVCSARGVERLRISVLKGGTDNTVATTLARCFPPERRGPALDPGTYDLKVEGLGFDGEPLRDPETGEQYALTFAFGVRLAKKKNTAVSVTLARPPRCADRVDNDGDGRVDSLDPGCWLTGDKGYVVVDAQGRHTYVPNDDDETDPPDPEQNGTVVLTWTVRDRPDGCAVTGPNGASDVAVSLNGEPAVFYPCTEAQATLALAPGEAQFEAWLVDDQGLALTSTLTADASVVGGQQQNVAFTFDATTLLTDTLAFTLFWESAGGGCQDASPMVEDHGILLVDAATDATVVGTVQLYGTPVDGSASSFAACVHPPEMLSIAPDLPTGLYHLTVWGRESGGETCWTKTLDLGVGPGAVDASPLVVDRTSVTGQCAP